MVLSGSFKDKRECCWFKVVVTNLKGVSVFCKWKATMWKTFNNNKTYILTKYIVVSRIIAKMMCVRQDAIWLMNMQCAHFCVVVTKQHICWSGQSRHENYHDNNDYNDSWKCHDRQTFTAYNLLLISYHYSMCR